MVEEDTDYPRVNLAPEEAPGLSRADSPGGAEFDPRGDAGTSNADTDEGGVRSPRGEEGPSPVGGGGGGEAEGGLGGGGVDDGYDSNTREYADDLDYDVDYGDDGVDVDVDADDLGYEDDVSPKAKAGGRGGEGGGGVDDEAEGEVGGGGALGIFSYLWMLVALALFAYLIMKVQDQAATIKVLQQRVQSLETRLGLQPMMPMEMQNQQKR